jgi:hypothetical protein
MALTDILDKSKIDKAKLLKHYARRNPKAFRQFDGWLNADEITGRDDDGHGTTAVLTWELMAAGDVRVLIPVSTTSAEATALLRKIIGWIERSGGVDRIVPKPLG